MEITNILSNMKFLVKGPSFLAFLDFYATLEYLIYLVKNAKFLRMENYVSNTACKCSFLRQIMKGKLKP